MSWCDKLASVPTVGLTLDWHFAPAAELITALSPLLNELVEGDKQKFQVSRLDAFSVILQTDSGFQYAVEPSKVVVSFQHRMRAKAVSGGAPIMEMISQAQPFTNLLTEVIRRLVEVTIRIPGPRNRKLTRVGVVTTTTVDIEDSPPGVVRLINYMGRPWGGIGPGSSFQIAGDVGSTTGWTDRCIHTYALPEPQDQIASVMFDWQRTFKAGHALHKDTLPEILKRSREDAEKYFEDLAEGNRFDENGSV